MRYENARDILPPELLRLVQKYVSGQLIYIPGREHKREWGEASGSRQALQERNQQIRSRFVRGESVETLAQHYHLSVESIRRIVYNTKEEFRMHYVPTIASAQAWAAQGCLEDWVHAYLLSDGHNRPFSDGLKLVDRTFLGPAVMPLELFHRCCGPEETMRWRIPRQAWENKVTELQQAVRQERELPPLIVHFFVEEGQPEGSFELNDGNHRLEAYQRLGISSASVIVWITDGDEVELFMQRYGNCLK